MGCFFKDLLTIRCGAKELLNGSERFGSPYIVLIVRFVLDINI
jgi:hypothetical protein